MSSTDQLTHFLNNAGRVDLLTADEEIELSRLIQQWQRLADVKSPNKSQKNAIRKGKAAYERFFLANVKLVVYIAKKFTRSATSMTLDDLIQEGCCGLSHAIKKFDPERGYKFSTYGYWWIRQAICRSIETTDQMIRVPVNGFQFNKKIRKFIVDYEIEHGKHPSLTACAEHLSISLEYMEKYLMHASGTMSLDAQINGGPDRSAYIDMIPAEQEETYGDLDIDYQKIHLDRILKKLDHIDREILDKGYGLSGGEILTTNQIASELKLSRNVVRFRRSQAIAKLRKYATSI